MLQARTRSRRTGRVERLTRTRGLVCGAGLVAVLLVPAVGLVAPSAQGATLVGPAPQVALNVLLLDDGAPMVGAVRDRLATEGVPVTRIDLTSPSRPQITAAYLAQQAGAAWTGNFSGIVLPSEAPAQLSVDERSVLSSYESSFQVREVDAYTWAHPEVGLNYASPVGYIGAVDGMTATITPAGTSAGFGYLNGSLALDDLDPTVLESWGYLATPLAADPSGVFTPLVTATIPGTTTQGSLMGQYTTGSREQLVVTFASNAGQQHFRTLAHGIVTWLTRGISTSFSRNYLSVNIDDAFLPDGRWSVTGACTIGDGCDPTLYPATAPGATIRMVPADVTALAAWQTTSGLKLDLAFNGAGSVEAEQKTGTADPLTTALVGSRGSFRWINHTYTHAYLGCLQNFATSPWSCSVDTLGQPLWTTTATIRDEIVRNWLFAASKLIRFDPSELVTGEHSGLKTLPQMPTDNPNLAPTLTGTGIRWIGADASREAGSRTVGSATTVPRHPMNIFYNTATKAEAASEYSWIYGRKADGGSGLCELRPDTTTCIAPLDTATGFDTTIVPIESRIALSHMLNNDPRPHYAHQSNLTEDRVLYPVLDRTLASYRSTFNANTPIVNPQLKAAGQALVDQQQWAATQSVMATVAGNVITIRNSGATSAKVPVTVPTGTRRLVAGILGGLIGSSYAGQNSGWVTIAAGASLTLQLPTSAGFTAPTAWPNTGPAAAVAAAPTAAVQNGPTTTVIRLPAANLSTAVKPTALTAGTASATP